MMYYFLFIYFLIVSPGYSQDTLKIVPAGQRLKQVYLSMDVENYWLAYNHVNWETGVPDMPEAVHGNKTHCSAFIAATCEKLDIYILRPPQHGQILLANAQYNWLENNAGQKTGWSKLPDDENLYKQVQLLANRGKVVVAIYKNTDSKKPGHAALVMPSIRTEEQLKESGPEIIMAGTHNYNYISLKNGFRSHITSWPSHEIAFFVHEVPAGTIK